MYIGADWDRAECVVRDITRQRPQEVRVLLWREDAITIAYDGSPLPIESFGAPVEGVSHPALYLSFMRLLVGREPPVAIRAAEQGIGGHASGTLLRQRVPSASDSGVC